MQYLPPAAADLSRAMPQPLLHHTIFILLEYSEIYVSLKRRKILLLILSRYGNYERKLHCGKNVEGKTLRKALRLESELTVQALNNLKT